MTHHAMMALASIGMATLICQWFAWWVKLPAILFLLLFGLLAGPVTGVLNPDELFGELLFPIVSLAVAVILFEGALTLKFDQISGLEKVVQRLVTTGVLVTWVIIALATRFIVELSWELSILFGALVVVTGPTVIVPMLRTVRPNRRISNILRWEGIVIDPVGALLAVLVFEFIVAFGEGHALSHTFIIFAKVIAVGLVIGAGVGHGFGLVLRHHALPEYLHNTAALALVCGAFAVSDAIEPESGLLTVTVMGLWLANMPRVEVEEILNFKESLSVVLISALFILLAARIDVETVKQLGWAGLGVFLVIQLIARPVKVLVSTAGSDLSKAERMLLGWIAPRGIVAAAVTALFALRLQELGYPGAELLVPLTFSVIIGTVVLQSTTAGALARYLKVAEPAPRGYLIIGANSIARTIAEALQKHDLPVLLTSSNYSDIRQARMAGLPSFYGRAVSEHADRHLELIGMGQMLGLEPHEHMNALAAMRYGPEFGRNRVYQLAQNDASGKSERDSVAIESLGETLFAENASYATLASLIAKGATISSTTLSENFDVEAYEQSRSAQSIPLFSIAPNGQVRPITPHSKRVDQPNWNILALNPATEPSNGADQQHMTLPILYSFRRCPYAIRARLALLYSGVQYTRHEVSFKDKPAHMLEISPKGTVPVLQLLDGHVIDESLDIAIWALQQHDLQKMLLSGQEHVETIRLITRNDDEFKHWLDRYKYADRYTEASPEHYRACGEGFLQDLECLLSSSAFLMSNQASLADIMIMPFVRQFAHVDKVWFEQSPYPNLQHWLQHWLGSPEFLQVMAKEQKER